MTAVLEFRHLLVIASAAKQSISPRKGRMDCFASLAMTWIGRGVLDAPPEPVIGLAEDETGGMNLHLHGPDVSLSD